MTLGEHKSFFKSFSMKLKEKWYAENVDLACSEILFRLLPGKGVVCVPAAIAWTLYQVWRVSEGAAEATAMLSSFVEMCSRADLLAIPIGNMVHWVLLVLERTPRLYPADDTRFSHQLKARDKVQQQKAALEQFKFSDWP